MTESSLATASVSIADATGSSSLDLVIVEEPLEIEISADDVEPIQVITMRSPGDDQYLALGFLYSEGLIESYADVVHITQPHKNQISISLTSNKAFTTRNFRREFVRSSSCGVCGSQSLETLKLIGAVAKNLVTVTPQHVFKCVQQLRQFQHVFELTGGAHGVAGFDCDGKVIAGYEDVGRHNALDKLVGFQLEHSMTVHTIVASSRAGYEMVQKAVLAKAAVLICIGAPTSLAVETAEHYGLRLFGFVKKSSYNQYV